MVAIGRGTAMKVKADAAFLPCFALKARLSVSTYMRAGGAT
jgi:hypothetical protein